MFNSFKTAEWTSTKFCIEVFFLQKCVEIFDFLMLKSEVTAWGIPGWEISRTFTNVRGQILVIAPEYALHTFPNIFVICW